VPERRRPALVYGPSTMEPQFDVETLARDIGQRISSQLPQILRQLLAEQNDFGSGQLQLECNLLNGQSGTGTRHQTLKLASFDITEAVNCATPSADYAATPANDTPPLNTFAGAANDHLETPEDSPVTPQEGSGSNSPVRTFRPRSTSTPYAEDDSRPAKRRATGGLRIGGADQPREEYGTVTRRLESDGRVFPQRKKRLPENPHLQPSTVS
jgi:hypothetical protein